MAIMSCNSEKLFKTLELLEACPKQNLLLIGKHGIGKSEILTKYHTDKGRKVVTIFLGQMADPGDLIGLPRPNEKTGRMDFMPPTWWPEDNQPIVLFLDELNRARPEILQVVMDLALNKRLAGRDLPEGSRIVAAVNSGAEYNVTDLDPALQSRFFMLEFKPTTEEWLEWAYRNEHDERLCDFIKDNPNMLDSTVEETGGGLNKTPDRRAWTAVSQLIKGKEIDELMTSTIACAVGVNAAAAFNTWMVQNRLPSAEKVLTQWDKTKRKVVGLHLHELSRLSDNLFVFLKANKAHEKMPEFVKGLENYAQFLYELPKNGKEGINKSHDPFNQFYSSLTADKNSEVFGIVLNRSKNIIAWCQNALKNG